MMSRLRQRLPMPIRLLMLAVLLFGTAGGALASALGDLHALSHAGSAGAAHALSHAEPADAADTVAEQGSDRLLHALVHCGHCHGHGGVLPLAASAWAVPLAPAHAVPVGLAAQLLAQPPESLLRPPIAV